MTSINLGFFWSCDTSRYWLAVTVATDPVVEFGVVAASPRSHRRGGLTATHKDKLNHDLLGSLGS
ncbi:hypothetical protein GCM10023322_31740 [Rugosimonospora acidiphila]|uniref:Uncharacterized protein n=1 Tax=Rugosimonospora acidiphila TaxID=556531 RepID=A0ABP9RTD5_9ACTN